MLYSNIGISVLKKMAKLCFKPNIYFLGKKCLARNRNRKTPENILHKMRRMAIHKCPQAWFVLLLFRTCHTWHPSRVADGEYTINAASRR